MTIHPAKASDWNSVNPENIAREIKYLACLNNARLEEVDAIDLGKKDKTQLKAIAAELTTIQKRLNWILDGQY